MRDDSSNDAGDPVPDQVGEQSAAEAAAALGTLFAEQLPNAQRLIDQLADEHPDTDSDKQIRLVKKHALRKLTDSVHHDEDAQHLRETVAELAVAIALLRGVKLRTNAEFAELGRRVMRSAENTAKLQERIGSTVPQAVSGIEQAARRMQPYVAELLFNALGGANPSALVRPVMRTRACDRQFGVHGTTARSAARPRPGLLQRWCEL